MADFNQQKQDTYARVLADPRGDEDEKLGRFGAAVDQGKVSGKFPSSTELKDAENELIKKEALAEGGGVRTSNYNNQGTALADKRLNEKDRKKKEEAERRAEMILALQRRIDALDTKINKIEEELNKVREEIKVDNERLAACEQIEELIKSGQFDPEKHKELLDKSGMSPEEKEEFLNEWEKDRQTMDAMHAAGVKAVDFMSFGSLSILSNHMTDLKGELKDKTEKEEDLEDELDAAAKEKQELRSQIEEIKGDQSELIAGDEELLEKKHQQAKETFRLEQEERAQKEAQMTPVEEELEDFETRRAKLAKRNLDPEKMEKIEQRLFDKLSEEAKEILAQDSENSYLFEDQNMEDNTKLNEGVRVAESVPLSNTAFTAPSV